MCGGGGGGECHFRVWGAKQTEGSGVKNESDLFFFLSVQRERERERDLVSLSAFPLRFLVFVCFVFKALRAVDLFPCPEAV